MAFAEVLGVNHHAPVALRVLGGVSEDDLVGEDAIDVMGGFRGEDNEPMNGIGCDGLLGSWPDGGVRGSSISLAAPLP